MAQKITVNLVDDLDGSEASETLSFGLDGKLYEIDLNKKNATKLRSTLVPFVEKGRKVTNGRPKRFDKEDAKTVRQWAREQGMDVSPRGAIPAEVRQAYRAAHA